MKNEEINDDLDKYLEKSIYLDNIFIYSCGKNEYGELGINKKTKCENIIKPVISLNNKIVSNIAVGGKHSMAIIDNEIYICGSDLLIP